MMNEGGVSSCYSEVKGSVPYSCVDLQTSEKTDA